MEIGFSDGRSREDILTVQEREEQMVDQDEDRSPQSIAVITKA